MPFSCGTGCWVYLNCVDIYVNKHVSLLLRMRNSLRSCNVQCKATGYIANSSDVLLLV